MIWTLKQLIDSASTCATSTKDKKGWVPARPMNVRFAGGRWREAWIVFTGRGDVVLWPDNQ